MSFLESKWNVFLDGPFFFSSLLPAKETVGWPHFEITTLFSRKQKQNEQWHRTASLQRGRQGGPRKPGPAYTRPREAGCWASRASVSSLYGEGERWSIITSGILYLLKHWYAHPNLKEGTKTPSLDERSGKATLQKNIQDEMHCCDNLWKELPATLITVEVSKLTYKRLKVSENT